MIIINQRGFVLIEGAIAVVIIVIVSISVFVFVSKKQPTTDPNLILDPTITPAVTEAPDPQGTIWIEAKDGMITVQDKFDLLTYLAETSRGLKAYLANREAQVTIPFNIINEQTKTYGVFIYTSDDGLLNSRIF